MIHLFTGLDRRGYFNNDPVMRDEHKSGLIQFGDAGFFIEVLENLGIPVYLIRTENYELLNINPDETGHRHCYEVSHDIKVPCSSSEHECGLKKAVELSRSVKLKHNHYSPDGELIPAEVHTIPIYNKDGVIDKVLEFCLNINLHQDKLPRLRILNEVFQQIPVSIVLTDKNGTIEYVNPKFTEINGYTLKEVVGKNPRILKDPDKASVEYKSMWQTISSGKSWHGIFHNRKKDGSFYWEDALIAPVKDNSGNIINYFAIKENITKRKELEEQLHLQARAMDDAKSSIIIIDAQAPDYPAIYVNNAFERITGYSRDYVIGKNLRFLSSHDRNQPELSYLREAIKNKTDCQCQLKNYRKDGSMFWNDLHIAPIKNEYGQVTHYVGFSEDVTEFRIMQKNLADNEQRLRLSQEYANIGTWDWNIQTGELLWSERIAPLFGNEEGKVEASYENFVNSIHPEDRKAVLDAVNNCIDNGDEYNIEHRCVWPDGTVRWLQESGDVFRDKKGSPLHMLGIVQDITDRVQTERELKESREEAERANMAKSEFLSSMSHELRTPMNAIIGFGQLLEMDSSLNDDQKDSVGEIVRAGKHLLDLINEILDLSRIELGKVELSIEPVSCRDLVSDCLTLITPLAQKNGIEITTDTPDDLLVMTDRLRMKQVLVNLLSNAVKYNKSGGSVCVDVFSRDRMVNFVVSDNGIGIEPHKLDGLFEPFNRLGADKREIEGSGIGLSISQKLVNIMGGNISVESTPGEGSVFTVEIPAVNNDSLSSENTDDDTADEPLEIVEGTHPVLYIEDNLSNLRLMKQALSKLDYVQLISAEEPHEGLRLAELHRPELILLDLNLPGMDGYEVLQKIRESDWGRSIPVVAVTANAMQKDIEKGMEAGFNDYLTKPLNISRLYNLIDSLLSPKK